MPFLADNDYIAVGELIAVALEKGNNIADVLPGCLRFSLNQNVRRSWEGAELVPVLGHHLAGSQNLPLVPVEDTAGKDDYIYTILLGICMCSLDIHHAVFAEENLGVEAEADDDDWFVSFATKPFLQGWSPSRIGILKLYHIKLKMSSIPTGNI